MDTSRHLTRDECIIVSTLIEEGHNLIYGANVLGLNYILISRMVSHFLDMGLHCRRDGQDVKWVATAMDDEGIAKQRVHYC